MVLPFLILPGCSTEYLVYESDANHIYHADAIFTQMELVADAGAYGIIAAKDEDGEQEENYYLLIAMKTDKTGGDELVDYRLTTASTIPHDKIEDLMGAAQRILGMWAEKRNEAQGNVVDFSLYEMVDATVDGEQIVSETFNIYYSHVDEARLVRLELADIRIGENLLSQTVTMKKFSSVEAFRDHLALGRKRLREMGMKD